MAKTIELGRAVLTTSSSGLDLWFTTQITLSPANCCIDIQQLNSTSVVDLLSSGSIWVGRGTALQIALDVMMRNEALPRRQMQELVNSLIDAPIWEQLMLQPSVLSGSEIGDGKARISIRYSDKSTTLHKSSPMGMNQAAILDAKPPEWVPSIYLDAVHLSLDFLEAPQQPPSKRLRMSSISGKRGIATKGEPERRPRFTLAHDPLGIAGFSRKTLSNQQRILVLENEPGPDLGMAKSDAEKIIRSPTLSVCKHEVFMPTAGLYETMIVNNDTLNFEMMVDAAMRFSVRSSLMRSSKNIKLRANTFHAGLADIAPAIWRPGYLHVREGPLFQQRKLMVLQAFTQRALLLSSISRSVCQIAETKSTSNSLCAKMAKLRAGHTAARLSSYLCDPSDEVHRLQPLPSPIVDQLWLYLQKRVPTRASLPLHDFITFRKGTPPTSNDILFSPGPTMIEYATGQVARTPPTLHSECKERAQP